MTVAAPAPPTVSARRWTTTLCWLAVALDGFDLVVLGVVLPVLIADRVWGVTAATGTVISTVGLAGMTVGAVAIGTVTDVVGRRRALALSVAVFSVASALCAVAPSAAVFALLRVVAGLGLGGCLPTALALSAEVRAAEGRSATGTTTAMTGYHVGAVVTSLLGIVLIPALGWRSMMVVGAVPGLVLAPLMLAHLPESGLYLQARQRRADATGEGGPAAARRAVRSLFAGGLWRPTLAFWATTFLGLILVFGLNTWLPQIMKTAGYPLTTALGLLLALNLGGIAGMVVGGSVADRSGVRGASLLWFLAAGVFLALLSVRLPELLLYAVVFLAGAFVFSGQALVYAYTQRVYPAHARATGLGWTAGVGRFGGICGPVLGGVLLSAGVAYPWGFYAFALVAFAGLGALSLVPGRPDEEPDPREELR